MAQIHVVKERLKKENEELKELKKKIRDVQDKIKAQKEVHDFMIGIVHDFTFI